MVGVGVPLAAVDVAAVVAVVVTGGGCVEDSVAFDEVIAFVVVLMGGGRVGVMTVAIDEVEDCPPTAAQVVDPVVHFCPDGHALHNVPTEQRTDGLSQQTASET